MGIEKSREKIEAADIVIALFDINQSSHEQIGQWTQEINADKLILVANKIDQLIDRAILNETFMQGVVTIAAKNQENIDALKKVLTQKAVGTSLNKEGTIVTNARHVESLKRLLYALNDVAVGLENEVTGDLLALDIRQALHYLGTITGQITNEDQLDFIFSKFCIGK
jgi:tRNA modification GTPase